MLMMRDDITPEDVQGLRDQITMLMMRDDITPEDVQGLRDQITMLMMRDDITPEDVQALRDQITRLTDMAPEAIQALQDEVTRLMMRADITPEDVQALRDQITTLMMRPTQADLDAAEDRGDAFEKAQNARDDATGAASAAKTAVTTATDASNKITALTVAGDSATAEANAQAVLDAYDDANEAVKTAQTALDNAKAALDPDAADSDALARALTAAIEAADGALKDAREQAESDALEAAVAAVKGDDPTADDYPMTPAQHGRAVAMDIGGALLPMSVEVGRRARGTHTSTAADVPDAPDLPAVDTVVRMNDHQGMTWTEIVGEANVMDMRIAQSGGGTRVVKAASFEGMPVTSITVDAPAVGDVKNGDEFTTANYKEIPGTVFCAGKCAVAEADEDGVSALTGSWYFNPDSLTAWYIRTTTAGVTTYSAETLYAQFGHWLSAVDSGPEVGKAMVNTYAMTIAGRVEGTNYELNDVNTAEDATTLTDSSANYSGPAAGMSVYKTFNTDGTTDTIQSAAFTAMVNLKATFAEDATLGGTVNGFSGDAVSSAWTVELQSTVFDGDFDNGRTVATGRDGEWTAQAYGPADGTEVRPTGIFGGFNAHFSDGHAAGAYATRKE
jgi:hypothetical protein